MIAKASIAALVIIGLLLWQMSRLEAQLDEAQEGIVIRDGALRQVADSLDAEIRKATAAEGQAIKARQEEQRRRQALDEARATLARLGENSSDEYRQCRTVPVPAALIDSLREYAGHRDPS